MKIIIYIYHCLIIRHLRIKYGIIITITFGGTNFDTLNRPDWYSYIIDIPDTGYYLRTDKTYNDYENVIKYAIKRSYKILKLINYRLFLLNYNPEY